VISYFETRNIISPTLKEIRESIIEIRKAKLPNPLETPNAGSYFGNPIVSKEKAEILLQKFPSMPMFDFEPSSSVTPTSLSFPWRRESMDQEYFSSEKSPDHNSTCQSPSLRLETLPSSPRIRKDDKQEYKKLFAGWLIDKAGLKGYENNNFSIHKDHALVIIGNEKGTLSELLEFESYIKQKVFEIFGVELEREPVIVN
jgi:UDP-N-acetylenolpyruvoylglucosamine reductase